jgi:acetyltransferase
VTRRIAERVAGIMGVKPIAGDILYSKYNPLVDRPGDFDRRVMAPDRPMTSRQTTHDIVSDRRDRLGMFFAPRNVAVIGATENPASVGRTVLWNLISSPFGGAVFPINPKRSSVLGIRAYPNIGSIPEPADLAVIVTPALVVPEVIRDCVAAGVRGAVVISAGFKEIGPAGADLERQIMKEARRGKLRVIGPNCLGVMSPVTGLNATFAAGMARPGDVAFISQSGALCTAILDWSLKEMVGFSAFVSTGSMLDVGWGDLIDHLGDDPRTRSIVIYMESIGDARSFLSAAREVALSKPIIVIKAGRTAAAAKAAASHTGALAGSDDVLDAAFRRSGVLRVSTISEIFYMTEVLARQPRPRGPRLMIVTNAGGPGVLATDALISDGGQLAELSQSTIDALNGVLPPHWSHNNPIDLIGDAGPDRYAAAVDITAKDPNSDGLLVIMTPQGMTSPTDIAEKLKPYSKLNGKPILASWMGDAEVAAGESILNRANIPTFPYPDTAARAFNYMWRYSDNLKGLYETPTLADDPSHDRLPADDIVAKVRDSGRTLLTEFESKQLLAAYGITTVETVIARSEGQAVEAAAKIGYPVVVKLHSESITHKTDVGGVRLNLRDASEVQHAWRGVLASISEKDFLGVTVQPMMSLDGYEVILGCSVDAQFGPVLLFGSGGQLVEVYQDRSLALPPLNTTLARRMMEQTKIFEAFRSVRGRPPVDLAALDQLLVRFSRLVVEQRWIREIDINPLLVSAKRLVALDARVIVYPSDTREQDLPKLAIRPYPTQYVWTFATKDAASVTVRPIRPEDEPLLVRFHETLSERSVYLRYFQALNLERRVAHERLTRLCFIDYDREMALVAEREQEIVGVGRLTRLHDGEAAEFAVVVSDKVQGLGLGTELLRRLVEIGRGENVAVIRGYIVPENLAMQTVAKKLGFQIDYSQEEQLMIADLPLR